MTNLTNALSDAFTTIQTDFMSALVVVLPICLAIFAAPFVIKKVMQFFNRTTAK